MININYQPINTEFAQATFDFLQNRPFMRFILFFMKLSCLLLCFGFAISLYYDAVRPQDYAIVLTALIWLCFYKNINQWVVKRSLKNRSMHNLPHDMNIDKQRIFYKANNNSSHLEWKKIRFVLKNSQGYIVPLSGLTNAGKFLWLPLRGFSDPTAEQQFVQTLQELKLKIKKI